MSPDGTKENPFKAGVLEVYYRGEWGTVCDDRSDTTHHQENNYMAYVVCRQLKYVAKGTVVNEAAFGKGTGKILLNNVDCTGNELRLLDCPHVEGSDCDHTEDVGISCY